MDTITIQELAVHYHVGVPDEERAHAQRLTVTLEMDIDFRPASASDDLTKTIDYFQVSQRLLKFGEGKNWRLIEKLAEDIARMVLSDFGAQTVRVEVRKFIIPEARWVSVKLDRTRE